MTSSCPCAGVIFAVVAVVVVAIFSPWFYELIFTWFHSQIIGCRHGVPWQGKCVASIVSSWLSLLKPWTSRLWPNSVRRSSRRDYLSFWAASGHPKTYWWTHHLYEASFQTSPWLDAHVHTSRNYSVRCRRFCEHCLVHLPFSLSHSSGPRPLRYSSVRYIQVSWRRSLPQKATSSALSRYQ